MNTTTIITKKGAAGEIETSAMVNCLKLLSAHSAAVSSVAATYDQELVGRMFTCKTCDRKFSSFQALGGHRASHKKTKSPNSGDFPDDASLPLKQKVHSCKICGVEFPTGQALGGHMRRHRENLVVVGCGGGGGVFSTAVSSVTTEGSSGNSDGNDGEKKRKMNDVVSEVPVLKKSSSSKRVCLDLDLDLTLWKKEEETVVVEKYEDDDYEIEEGEIVEQQQEQAAADQEKDFLKLELRQPINCW